MDKEVVKENKEVFDWWLDGGNVWTKHPYEDWELITNPSWHSKAYYVQDDAFVEYRKAFVDNKVVETLYYIEDGDDEKPVWEPITIPTFSGDASNYRVRKHNFKIGNYVRVKGTKYAFKIVREPIDDLFYEDVSSCWDYEENEYGKYRESDLELWEPKEDEWVIVHKPNKSTCIIKYSKETLYHEEAWIVPFIGQITWEQN